MLQPLPLLKVSSKFWVKETYLKELYIQCLVLRDIEIKMFCTTQNQALTHAKCMRNNNKVSLIFMAFYIPIASHNCDVKCYQLYYFCLYSSKYS